MKKILLFLFILCSFAGSAQLSPTQIFNMPTYSGNMTNGVLVVSYTSGGSIFGRKISMRSLLDSVARVSWNGIIDPTGDQALSFGAGESSTWTSANTTEDLFTVNTSTLTTSSLFSLNSTGTALAAGNNLMELVMSGANGTNAITATGLRISVTNTNVTSGTNLAAVLSASGATTTNFALLTGAGGTNDGRLSINNATNDANFAVIIRGVNDNGGNGIIKLLSNNQSANMQFGYNTITGSAGMNLSTPAGAITFSTTGASQNINSTADIINLISSAGTSIAPVSFTPTGLLSVGSGAATTAYALALGGSGYTTGGMLMNPSTSPGVGNNGFLYGSTGTIVEAGSGTHAIIAGMLLFAPTITGGSATVTDAATLNIASPTSATVTGGNYALLVSSGRSKFLGSITHSYRSVSGNDNITAANDEIIEVTANSPTLTLPDATGLAGIVYTVINSGAGIAVVATTSSQVIGNSGAATSMNVVPAASLSVVSTGSAWRIY